MGHNPVVSPGRFEVHWILAHQQESRKLLNVGSYEFSTNKEGLKKKHKQVNGSQLSASRRGCSSHGAVGQASWERRSPGHQFTLWGWMRAKLCSCWERSNKQRGEEKALS